MCYFFEWAENFQNQSILIIDSCSTNVLLDTNSEGHCYEMHVGNVPRTIMSKGFSMREGHKYGRITLGNNDKLMISYRRESTHDYTMDAR